MESCGQLLVALAEKLELSAFWYLNVVLLIITLLNYNIAHYQSLDSG